MNMVHINKNTNSDIKIQNRARVEASLVEVLKGHIDQPKDRQRFAPLAYDKYHEVNNVVPANAQDLQDFLLKHAEGKALMAEAKAIFKANADAQRAAQAAAKEAPAAPAPVVAPLPKPPVASQLPSEIVDRLEQRALDAYQEYLNKGAPRDNPRDLLAVLDDMAAACKAYGSRDFPIPCMDFTPMSMAFFAVFAKGKETGRFEKRFRLAFQPGGTAKPKGQPKGKGNS